MGRFDEKYPREQSDAIVRAQVEDDMTAREAVERAKAGELYGLEPFGFNLKTASAYGTKERTRRLGRAQRARESGPPEERIKAIADRTINSIQHRLAKLDRKRQWTQQDAALSKALIQNLRELDALVKEKPKYGGTNSAKRHAAQQGQNPNSDTEIHPTSDLVRATQRDIKRSEDQNEGQNGDATSRTQDPGGSEDAGQLRAHIE